jgi:enoyl-CoA hydratase/carnithine racemase
MSYETVKYEKVGRIGVLTFNRPQVMNAHNYAMKVEEQAVADEVAADDGVQVLVMTGEGRGFHTGEDVKDVFLGGEVDQLKRDRLLSLVGRIPSTSWTGQVSPIYFYGYPKPTIAAVNGPAVGAGLSIAISCDIRIASPAAKFGYFYTRRGLMGTTRGLTMLIHQIGVSRTMEMMLSGEMVDAEEAARIGLVSRVVEADALMDDAMTTAEKLLRGAPLAQRAIKASLYKALYEPYGIEDYNARVEAALIETEDHVEGALAFTEKRDPQWVNR